MFKMLNLSGEKESYKFQPQFSDLTGKTCTEQPVKYRNNLFK